MASSSSSSRRKEKVVRVTRNANPSRWISDEEIRGKFLFWRVIKYMKGDRYPDLVEVFYTNLRVVNGVIHSRVKGVNVTIDDNVWSHIVGLIAEVDKQYLHDGLNKEEKLIAYVLTWLLLPGRFVEDRMSTEDVFLLNAIKTRIPTNWVAVLKDRMIAADELTIGSTPTPTADHTAFIPQTDFEKYVVVQFRKKSKRDERVEDTFFIWEKKRNKNGIGFETKDSNDVSTDED
ncbi:hypothetical protein LR48_Vigan01g125000 [Vigna angularis]|uniref:Uncharacterized protein n=1 Tax=Phaseolus angularis TaxID=3914 RepID=A0A0L9TMA8_PHAAN|nr:hypothetical protein LR48_Vigan01g125000 [Vigna angularis]